MAWQAVITGWDLNAPSVTVGYYEDTNPANASTPTVFLYSQAFRRADLASNTDFRVQVIQTGQRIRQVYQRIQAIKAAGAIAIP